MQKETELLYNSRWIQIKYAIAGFVIGGIVFWNSYKDRDTIKAPLAGYFFGSLLLIVGIYFTRAFFRDKPVMVLSKQGIDFRHDGFYSWDLIDSFNVVHYTGETTSSDLLFHFKFRSKISVSLFMLEMDWKDVVVVIQKWNTSTAMCYKGESTN